MKTAGHLGCSLFLSLPLHQISCTRGENWHIVRSPMEAKKAWGGTEALSEKSHEAIKPVNNHVSQFRSKSPIPLEPSCKYTAVASYDLMRDLEPEKHG